MRCGQCGEENAEGVNFCKGCGKPLQDGGRRATPVRPMGSTIVPPVNQVIPNYKPGVDYNPLGMWTYFGYDILFAIPLVGWIFLLVFAFGGGNNINLKNYARSKFCLLIIVAVLIVLVGGASGILSAMM